MSEERDMERERREMERETRRMERETERMEREAKRVELENFQKSHHKMKTITIRGVATEIYDVFSQKMKVAGVNMGDAVTKMMSDVVETFEDTFPDLSAENLRGTVPMRKISVNNHDELSINLNDLVESEVRVAFNHVEELKFEADVTKEAFLKYVASINGSTMVKLPATLPKLIILSKLNHCEDVEFYKV